MAAAGTTPGASGTKPRLPSLFVIGDSISIHYGPYLRSFVQGRYAYARKTAEPESVNDSLASEASGRRDLSSAAGSLDYPLGPFAENAGDSGMVLAYLASWPAAMTTADVILLNCGLHDLKIDRVSGRHQVHIEAYRENLERIVDSLAGVASKVLWCTSTPVDDATHAKHGAELTFKRVQADVVSYNAVATQVMQTAAVPVVDLHALTLALLDDSDTSDLYVDHVHFAPQVRALQAAYIAGRLENFASGA